MILASVEPLAVGSVVNKSFVYRRIRYTNQPLYIQREVSKEEWITNALAEKDPSDTDISREFLMGTVEFWGYTKYYEVSTD